MVAGARGLVFLIGGANGLAPATVAQAHRRLSLSALTLPHRLARVILCEQIYRAISVIRGEPYNR
jgi:23S rRNA (pseudouridine1915-N3)-methyltransferase